jgi:hypothetical protein
MANNDTVTVGKHTYAKSDFAAGSSMPGRASFIPIEDDLDATGDGLPRAEPNGTERAERGG